MDKATVLAELARVVAAQAGRDTLPHRLCRAAVSLLGAEGAAVTIAYTKPHRVTLCSTDDTAARLEDLQDVLGEGPGPTAFTTGQPVHAEVGGRSSGETERWPSLGQAVRDSLGPVAVVAIPIHPDHEVLGVLTVHLRAGSAPLLDPAARQFLADAVGVALLSDPDRLTTDLTGPWGSRSEVHQATGMVVSQLGVEPDDALALLRAHAYAHSWSLGQVASAVLARDLDFSHPDRETDPATGPSAGQTDSSDGTDPR